MAEAVIRTRMNGLTLSAGPLPPRGAVRRRFGIPPDAPFVLALGRIGHEQRATSTSSMRCCPSIHADLLIAGPNADDGALDAEARHPGGMPGSTSTRWDSGGGKNLLAR